jgi:hypothetical protein
MTEAQEQARLAELRQMAEQDTGAVSLLAYETQWRSKLTMYLRLRATLTALHQIKADPANAQAIAAAALAADIASI